MLSLSYNNFVGPIPISIKKLVNLRVLDLSNNKLEGELPSCLERLTATKLSHNAFSSFGKSSGVLNETRIRVLKLSSNSFQGQFPHQICKLGSLKLLELSNNLFNRSIPQCLKDLSNSLEVLLMRNDCLGGIFPDIFVNGTKLKALDVSDNQLEGNFPKSLINAKALDFLNMERNKIKDKFPYWLGSLPSLHVLLLRSNQFYGPLYHSGVSIGFQSLRVINVSYNHFTGILPPFYFSSWHKMTTLTGNYDDTYMEDLWIYTGSYRNSMEMVHKGVDTEFEQIRRDFVAIDFSGNRFCGNIPN